MSSAQSFANTTLGNVAELRVQAEAHCEYATNYPGCWTYEFKDGSKLQVCHTTNKISVYNKEEK